MASLSQIQLGNATYDISPYSLKACPTLNATSADSFLTAGVLQWANSDGTVITGANGSGNDGAILSFGWSDAFGAQIWLDDGSGEGGMQIRNRKEGTSWNPWRQVITSYNIGDQSVNYANSAGTANSVAWNNISGKPSTFPPSAHTHRTLENIDSSDVASSSATQRYVFISWNDLITNPINGNVQLGTTDYEYKSISGLQNTVKNCVTIDNKKYVLKLNIENYETIVLQLLNYQQKKISAKLYLLMLQVKYLLPIQQL